MSSRKRILAKPAAPAPAPAPPVVAKPVAPAPPSGLVRALLIGINYTNSPWSLRGCINDVETMSSHLQAYFPTCKDYRVLTDNTQEKPTRANILAAIQWLVSGLKPGEHVFFHYSGHGGTVRDVNGDEVEGLDSCIYPFNNGQMEKITDDELRAVLVNKVPAGSKCFAILDCCHSGTAVDLRYSWQVPSDMTLLHRESKKYENSTGDVVVLSGCQDNQTSADTVGPDGRPCGALTWSLIDTWKAYGPAIKLKYILWDVHTFLRKRGYSQLPELTTGKYMDINSVFDLRIV